MNAAHIEVAVEIRAMDDLFRSLVGEKPLAAKKCEVCGRTPRMGFLNLVDHCIECEDLGDIEDQAEEFGVDSVNAEQRARAKALVRTIKSLGGKPEFGFPALLK